MDGLQSVHLIAITKAQVTNPRQQGEFVNEYCYYGKLYQIDIFLIFYVGC